MKVVEVAEKIAKLLSSRLTNGRIYWDQLLPRLPKINNKYRYQCIVKYKKEPKLTETLKMILDHYQQDSHKTGLQISMDKNPYLLM